MGDFYDVHGAGFGGALVVVEVGWVEVGDVSIAFFGGADEVGFAFFPVHFPVLGGYEDAGVAADAVLAVVDEFGVFHRVAGRWLGSGFDQVDFVVLADFFGEWSGDEVGFFGFFQGLVVAFDFLDLVAEGAGGVAGDEDLVAGFDLAALHVYLSDFCLIVIVVDQSDEFFFFGGLAAGGATPVGEEFAEVIAVAESPVVDFFQFFQPEVDFFRGELAGGDGGDGFTISVDDGGDVFGGAAAAFDFEDVDAGGDQFVEEWQSAEVFWAHDVAVFDLQFDAAFVVDEAVGFAAFLEAGAALGGGVV